MEEKVSVTNILTYAMLRCHLLLDIPLALFPLKYKAAFGAALAASGKNNSMLQLEMLGLNISLLVLNFRKWEVNFV